MFAVSREAGRFVISEPELLAQLTERAASGALRCALCGAALEAEELTLVRRRLPHRWATLPAHRTCARQEGEAPAPLRPAPPGPGDEAEERPARGLPPARLGRLAGRLGAAAVVLEYGDEAEVGEALIALGLGDAVPVPDFDPAAGPGVRALHAAFADVPVFVVPNLRVVVDDAATDRWRVTVSLGAATLCGEGGGDAGRVAFARARAGGGCVVLLAARSSFSGPGQPAAALLVPPPVAP